MRFSVFAFRTDASRTALRKRLTVESSYAAVTFTLTAPETSTEPERHAVPTKSSKGKLSPVTAEVSA